MDARACKMRFWASKLATSPPNVIACMQAGARQHSKHPDELCRDPPDYPERLGRAVVFSSRPVKPLYKYTLPPSLANR
jgi:hypothetical protein